MSQLALVYMEPVTDQQTAESPHVVSGTGFSMGFSATIVPIEVKPAQLIPKLLQRAKEIGDMDRPPAGAPGCKDCQALEHLIGSVSGPE